jgi:hypothetical protein
MYLLLGDPQDLCCLAVQAALKARGYPTCIVSNPLASPSRFAWRLNNEESTSQLIWGDEEPLLDENISGLLVRPSGLVDPRGWQGNDLAYMQAETYAALLAWLWSLPCPVVNRCPPAIWYQSYSHPLSWYRLLRQCGLPTVATLVTNVEDEARTFGQQLAQEGVAGAVYGPLTRDIRYLVTDEKDWDGLAAMQRRAPVCLTYPHEEIQFVCVVGEQIVWEGQPSAEVIELEPALRSFAIAAGLTFVELALAHTAHGMCVIAVEPYTKFEHFGQRAQQQIVDHIVKILSVSAAGARNHDVRTSQRSLL